MLIQDGPSSESSSYLNVTLRYLGLWDSRVDLEMVPKFNNCIEDDIVMRN